MTEKRFKRREYAIYEEGNPICMTLRDVDIRLNELWEENEVLKQFIKELTTKGTGKIDLASGYSYKVNAVLSDYRGGVE